MRRYLDNALIFDLIGCVLIGTLVFSLRVYIKSHISIPSVEVVAKFMDSVLKVATPLIGFLLTIVSIIVTFRNSFESQKPPSSEKQSGTEDATLPPATTVFDRTVSKKSQFYDTDLHKKVMQVFLSSVYELGIVVFLFLALQSGFFSFGAFWLTLLTFLGFLCVLIAVSRSFYIYRLFLGVHVKK